MTAVTPEFHKAVVAAIDARFRRTERLEASFYKDLCDASNGTPRKKKRNRCRQYYRRRWLEHAPMFIGVSARYRKAAYKAYWSYTNINVESQRMAMAKERRS